MSKFVLGAFKTIMFAMIFVFVFDMASYLYKAVSFNQRMESIMTSMQKVVQDNNYLPEGQATMYKDVLKQLQADMRDKNDGDFVAGFNWNYGVSADKMHGTNLSWTSLEANVTNSKGTTSKENIVNLDMKQPADYGDIMCVRVQSMVYQPGWFFATGKNNAPDWTRNVHNSTTWFDYVYYVPCTKYQKVVK